jgi:hypothetical protein
VLDDRGTTLALCGEINVSIRIGSVGAAGTVVRDL